MNAIGILGTGRMGIRLAVMFADAGQRVILGSRDPARSARIVQKLERERITSEPWIPGKCDRFAPMIVSERSGK
ncbi:MAG: NAD(P)-binding domain-containing protein [Fischerella sp.]|uniref:NAD(P)-binding domain-containing protein n=1 Tax=Fischerella sp. TaxID=1191 RepID=UPI00184CE7AB|nr:NAD(P)-binding domain-containing protein [Fischerella sp.]NWF59415.1 NAD(P)-binding domain-containing protein [Fischerella sp.]